MATEFETTVLNGLPVVVTGRQECAEPDCGYNRAHFEIWNVEWLRGGTLPRSMWQRMQRNGDLDRIADEGMER